jgi:hypothetical protein
MGNLVARIGQMRKTYQILVGKTHGDKPFAIYGHRQKTPVKMDSGKIESEAVCWIHLAQDRVQCQTLVKMVNIVCVA